MTPAQARIALDHLAESPAALDADMHRLLDRTDSGAMPDRDIAVVMDDLAAGRVAGARATLEALAYPGNAASRAQAYRAAVKAREKDGGPVVNAAPLTGRNARRSAAA